MLGTKLFCTGHFQLLDAVSEMLHLLITIYYFLWKFYCLNIIQKKTQLFVGWVFFCIT